MVALAEHEASGAVGIDVRAEVEKCRASAEYFIHNYVVIDDVGGENGGEQPFHLWPEQRDALRHLERESRVIFLKARQLGITWLCLGYALWLMLFRDGQPVLLFSQGQVEAGEMLRRLKAMYERLPGWLSAELPRRVLDNASSQGWANNSWCKCLPATARAGRSFTAALVLMDEAAHQQTGGKLYAALKACVGDKGQLFVVSSANGHDGFFDVLWEKAQAGLNAFRAIFLSWRARPGRDEAWRLRQFAESADPELVKQEYPDNPSEAFVASGRTRFRPEWVSAQHARALPPLRPGDFDHPKALAHLDGFAAYLPNLGGRSFAIGADVAEGDGGDYSAATVIDRDTREEFAHLHGHWEPGEFAEKLAAVSSYYRAAEIVVERNNHGHAVLLRLGQLCPERVAKGHDGKAGWLTNKLTKPQSIDLLAEGLRDGTIAVRTPATLDEMRNYSVLDGGKTSAPEGKHDDRVMSWAVVIAWLKLGAARTGPLRSGGNPAGDNRGSRSLFSRR